MLGRRLGLPVSVFLSSCFSCSAIAVKPVESMAEGLRGAAAGGAAMQGELGTLWLFETTAAEDDPDDEASAFPPRLRRAGLRLDDETR